MVDMASGRGCESLERKDGWHVDIRCAVCPRFSEETVLHRFWKCLSAQCAWQFAIHIMNILVAGKDAQGPWQPLSWKQGIFSNRIPRKFDQLKRIWLELHLVALWSIWLERNNCAFNNQSWPPSRLMQLIWTNILDYGRVEWDCINRASRNS